MASFIDEIWGSKPDVAPYQPTDLGASELQAIMDNIDAWPQIENLGNLYENYMLNSFDEAGLDLGSIIKQGGEATSDLYKTGESFLGGNIPPDIAAKIQRSSAFQNLSSGVVGSPMAAANDARNYGLTTLDLINKGAGLIGEAGSSARSVAGLASGLIMSPSGEMVTPQEQVALTMQNNLYRQATQQLQYNINAAPSPFLKGINDTVINLVGAYLGAGRGGGGSTAPTTYQPAGMTYNPSTNWGSNVGQGEGYGQPVTTAASDYNVFDPSGGYMYG